MMSPLAPFRMVLTFLNWTFWMTRDPAPGFSLTAGSRPVMMPTSTLLKWESSRVTEPTDELVMSIPVLQLLIVIDLYVQPQSQIWSMAVWEP